ncbi:MAG: glucosamine 6-phosphate synthetase [Oscillospiraceae bacterium]|nr:glucosamine 6-phosphate synthetase [Oscillospiraceae bacterium]
MCALFGYLDCGKKIPHKTLQKLVQALANASEERGDHASGIAYKTGGKLTIYKRPRPAHKMKFRIPKGTMAVMGHTRFTTQGDQKKNYNNHPFHGKAELEFALAHNGVLYNDAELRKKKQLPKTQIETDSYVAVQLIEREGELNFESLRSMAESVRGSFTFTILDERNNLYFVKGSSPLYLIYFPDFGLYVYASTAGIMHKALKAVSLNHLNYEVIAVEDGEILRITPSGSFKRDAFTPVPPYAFGKYSGSIFGWEDEYPESTDDYAILLEMCGYFGVTPEEVRRLIDLGFSYDEIEMMLWEPSVLEELEMVEI